MKRWIAAILAAILTFSCVGALAETFPTEKLAGLIVKMRDLLNIPDDYDTFYSNYSFSGGDADAVIWSLNWQGTNRSAYVTCDESGVVYDYYRYEEQEDNYYYNEYTPRLPEKTLEESRAAAEALLEKMVGENEGFLITRTSCSTALRSSKIYAYEGRITCNGYETENTFYLALCADDLKVRSFSRGGNPGMRAEEVQPQISQDQARQMLEGAYSLELRYISDGKGGTRLAYVPVPGALLAVDAVTGEMRSRDRYSYFSTGDMGAVEDRGEASKAGLTPVEMDGVAQLEGVRTQAEMDEALRSRPEWGLTDEYALTYFSVYTRDNQIVASLDYALEGSDGSWYKYFILDARTMQALYAYTVAPYNGAIEYAPDLEKARQSAEAFVNDYYADQAQNLKCTGTYVPETPWEEVTTVYFKRVENGVLYEDNGITVEIDTARGTVKGVDLSWNEGMSFSDPSAAQTAEVAQAVYFSSMSTKAMYLQFYNDAYYTGYQETLCYVLASEKEMAGLDAETLEPIWSEGDEEDQIAYEDADEASETAALLARYGVGYPDGRFDGEREATLRDALLLMLSAVEGSLSGCDDSQIVDRAVSWGILTRGEYNLDEPVTRMWFARTLVAASGYGKAADFTEIYVPGFADAGQLTGSDIGYAAIARGMGIAVADSSGCFHPEKIITRAQAADMLGAFLSRK